MAEKKPATQTTKPAPESTKAKQPQKTRPSASIGATDALTGKTTRVPGAPRGTLRQ
jgi:hypothetical protein